MVPARRARLRLLLSRAALLAVAACLAACGVPRAVLGPGAHGASGELKVVTTFLSTTLREAPVLVKNGLEMEDSRNPSTYLRLMRSNAESLRQAFGG